jgi:ring-1,2-phenylacetyl-CoA epoxidase subunit PaaD
MVTIASHTKTSVMEILSVIKDPEIPVVSIEEMGMLRDVQFRDGICEIIITPTYTGCPAVGIIEQDIRATLHQQGIEAVKVTLQYVPAWTTDWMSDSTKEKLTRFGIAAPVHSSCAHAFDPNSLQVVCPRCGSQHTRLVSAFGSTACKALYKCLQCHEPFDSFKCH